jgi:adenosylcobinamide kinase/adenosylcobinamide-phosphate guanylyltransferase
MNVLISGGCKNGKTSFAEDIAVRLSGGGKRYYVATMIPYDDEDRRRIALHIEERAEKGFETLEIPRDIGSAAGLGGADGTYLVDSVTALLLNEMYPGSFDAEADPAAAERCRNGLLRLAREAKNAVFVSDWLYSDAARYDEFTENYRRDLASIDRALAEVSDTVIEMTAGIPVCRKGRLPG